MGGVGAKSQTAKNKEKANKTQNVKTKSGGAGGGSSRGRVDSYDIDNYKLTKKEEDRISKLNEKNEWGMTERQFKSISTQYKNAAKKGNVHKLALIEARLEDINYHREIRDLRKKAGITN